MWAKVCDTLAFHPKVLAAGNQAVGAWVRLLAWSCGQGTDGVIPISLCGVIAGEADFTRLVDVGLLERDPAGFRIHDFADYQVSADRARAETERKRRNLQAFRDRQRTCGFPRETADEIDFIPVAKSESNHDEITARTRTQKEDQPPVLRTDPTGVAKGRAKKAKEPKQDLDLATLSPKELAAHAALVADETLSAISSTPGRLAKDLCDLAPGIDVAREIKAAGAWLRANPERRRSSGNRFLNNWLKRAQDRFGGRQMWQQPAGYRQQPAVADGSGWKARQASPQEMDVNSDDIPY